MADRLLFVTRRPPFPLDNGARIRAHRLVRGLTAGFDVRLLMFAPNPGAPEGDVNLGELSATLPNVEIVTVPDAHLNKRVRQAISVASTRSFEFGRFRQRQFGEVLERLRREWKPSVVHFDDAGVAAFAPLEGTLNVFFPPNIEHRVIRDNARASGGVRRIYGELEWRKVRHEELRAARSTDLCTAVSEADAELLRAGGVTRVEICPNGTDRVEMLPTPSRNPGETFRMLFIGSGAYRPYETGLAWFLENVYPGVADAVPSSFDVVGERPQRPRTAPGVEYHGRVPSVQPYYERAHAVVVPVFEGSGTRLKVIEAMALGRPVVSTTLGAEGLGLTPGEQYHRADDPQAFATQLVDLANALERPDATSPMLAAARDAAAHLFWDVVTARLVEIYRAGLSSPRAIGRA